MVFRTGPGSDDLRRSRLRSTCSTGALPLASRRHPRPDRPPRRPGGPGRPRRRRVDRQGRGHRGAGRLEHRPLQGGRGGRRGGGPQVHSNVVKIYTPNATWSRVRAAAQGATVLVYLGHGNGWPSIYPPFQMLTKDGLGLDPSTGADGTQDRLLRRGLHPERHPPGPERRRAPVPPLLRLRQHRARPRGGHVRRRPPAGGQLRRRVHRGGRPGGVRRRASRATRPPTTSASCSRPSRTMDQVFRAAPSRHGHVARPVRLPAHARPAVRDGPGHRHAVRASTDRSSGTSP